MNNDWRLWLEKDNPATNIHGHHNKHWPNFPLTLPSLIWDICTVHKEKEQVEAEYCEYKIAQDQIEATVRETWAGLKAMAREIAPEFGIYL